MERLRHSPAFSSDEMAWVADLPVEAVVRHELPQRLHALVVEVV